MKSHIFNHPQFGLLRVFEDETGALHFSLEDVARALGMTMKEAQEHLRDLQEGGAAAGEAFKGELVPVRMADVNGRRQPTVSSLALYNYLYGRNETSNTDHTLTLEAAKQIAQGEEGPRARELYEYLAGHTGGLQ